MTTRRRTGIRSLENRMTRRTTLLPLALLLSMAALEGCRKKIEPAPSPSATGPASAGDIGTAQRRADSLAADATRRRADSLAALQRSGVDAQRTQADMTTLLLQKIYFDYDQDVLRDDASAALDAKAAVLLANPAVTLTITGHTDERGTAEYNLALGQRRAAQVKRYLVSRGVPEGRLATQSLGDSQPAVMGTDDSAFQLNRRAEFEIQNGGALVRPRP
jgi:peptidoglycan-associated lipoprotein